MKEVNAPKWSSLRPKLVEAMTFLKLNMSLIPNSLADVVDTPIWNTLFLSCLELPNDIDDSDDNEIEENDDDNDDDDDLSQMPVEGEETNYMC
jgi:hypothetical protein